MQDLVPDDAADSARFPYLAALNQAQREAVEALDGPVLMLAGAGTGKTRALTTRLAHLLFSGRAMPGQVLAVTFTNKAAREMKERVGRPARPPLGRGLVARHLPCHGRAHLARATPSTVGLKRNFTILDTDDQTCACSSRSWSPRTSNEKTWPARLLARHHRALEGPGL